MSEFRWQSKESFEQAADVLGIDPVDIVATIARETGVVVVYTSDTLDPNLVRVWAVELGIDEDGLLSEGSEPEFNEQMTQLFRHMVRKAEE